MTHLRGVTNRDVKKVIREAMRAGCEVSVTGGGHLRIDTPGGPYFAAMTASDHRAAMNVRVALRRRGVDI